MKTNGIKISIVAALLISATSVYATSVKEVVQHTMVKNPEIISIIKNDEAYKYYVDEEKGAYRPNLDLTTYIGTKKTKNDPDDSAKNTVDQDGYRMQLDLEQLLYDGGNTSARVDEANKKVSSNLLRNQNRVENIMFESIVAYLDMVQADEKKLLARENISTHKEYMVTAKETEEISGEALNRIQVSAKIHFAQNRLLDEVKNKKVALNNFEKSVGMKPVGNICRPNMHAELEIKNKKELIERALKNNFEILEQIENIEQQRAVLNQAKSNFLPTIKFKAQAVIDDDLEVNDAHTNIYSGRIELTYNIYNGKQDQAVQSREMKFLEESQKSLDVITKDVIDRIAVAYDTYEVSKKQIAELKMYIVDNQEILSVYQDQFEGGTRKFIDVLNAESDIYNAKIALVDTEYELMNSYYEIFVLLSNLQKSVLASPDQVCKEMKVYTKSKVQKDESLSDLSEMFEESTTSSDPSNMKTINDSIINEFKNEIDNDVLVYDPQRMSLRLSNRYLEKNRPGVKLIPEHKEVLSEVFPRYVSVIKKHSDIVKQVRVEGHASSVFKNALTSEEKFNMNKTISYQRAKVALNYGKSLNNDIVQKNIDLINSKFKLHGMSSSNTIKDFNGVENQLLSKRVEFVIVSK